VAAMAADLQSRIAELDSVLTAGLHQGPGVSFALFKHTVEMPPFDPGGLDRPVAEPQWEQFAPPPPGALGRILGWMLGRTARGRSTVPSRGRWWSSMSCHLSQ
jgi:restriction system protein